MKLIKREIEGLATNPRTTLAFLCVIIEFAVFPLALTRIQNLIPITVCFVIEMSLRHHNQQKRADLREVSISPR
jgi:hypothetical protein